MSAIQSDNGQEFEINLAPIIDCFTVLITYLLVSASFISLVVFDVGVAIVGPTAQTSKPVLIPPFNLTIELASNRSVVLGVTGGPKSIDLKFPVPALKNNQWATDAIKLQLSKLKSSYPGLKEATLNAQPEVIYRDIVKLVEQLKTVIEKIYLSG